MLAKNYQLIEMVKRADLTSQGDRLQIVDQATLTTLNNRAIQITSISAYPSTACPQSPSGIPVAPPTEFLKAFLVLNVGSLEKLLHIPMAELNIVRPDVDNYVPGVREIFQLDRITDIDWSKCYITFGVAPTNAVYCFLIGVRYYVLPGDIAGRPVPGLM